MPTDLRETVCTEARQQIQLYVSIHKFVKEFTNIC